jgi:hypothetical protein
MRSVNELEAQQKKGDWFSLTGSEEDHGIAELREAQFRCMIGDILLLLRLQIRSLIWQLLMIGPIPTILQIAHNFHCGPTRNRSILQSANYSSALS